MEPKGTLTPVKKLMRRSTFRTRVDIVYNESGPGHTLLVNHLPLMDLQRNSIESPFTYMYVINTTYYYQLYIVSHN